VRAVGQLAASGYVVKNSWRCTSTLHMLLWRLYFTVWLMYAGVSAEVFFVFKRMQYFCHGNVVMWLVCGSWILDRGVGVASVVR